MARLGAFTSAYEIEGVKAVKSVQELRVLAGNWRRISGRFAAPNGGWDELLTTVRRGGRPCFPRSSPLYLKLGNIDAIRTVNGRILINITRCLANGRAPFSATGSTEYPGSVCVQKTPRCTLTRR